MPHMFRISIYIHFNWIEIIATQFMRFRLSIMAYGDRFRWTIVICGCGYQSITDNFSHSQTQIVASVREMEVLDIFDLINFKVISYNIFQAEQRYMCWQKRTSRVSLHFIGYIDFSCVKGTSVHFYLVRILSIFIGEVARLCCGCTWCVCVCVRWSRSWLIAIKVKKLRDTLKCDCMCASDDIAF